MKINNISLL